MPPQVRLGDQAKAPVDAHGCTACPHTVQGPASKGSPTVKVNSRPAIRLGDTGNHAACCAAQTWVAAKGSATVMINNQPAFRKGDQTTHCGGVGMAIQGSENVVSGD